MKRETLFLAALLLCGGAATIPAQQTAEQASPAPVPLLSLEEATEQALASGGDLRAAELTYEQARLQYEQVKAASGPSLGAGADLGYAQSFDLAEDGTADDDFRSGAVTGKAALTFSLPLTNVALSGSHGLSQTSASGVSSDPHHTTTGSLSVSQTLWDGIVGGSAKLSLEQAREALIAQALSREAARRDLAYNVAQAYTAMLSAQRTVELRQASMEQRTAELDRTRILIETGKAAEIDGRQAEINARSAEIDRRASSSSLVSARARLALLVGMDPATPFAVRELGEPALPATPLDEAVAAALSNRLDLKLLRMSRASGDIDLKLTAAAASPTVSLSGSAEVGRDWYDKATDGSWSAQLKVSLPVFDSGATARKVDARKVANAVTELKIAELEQTIRSEVVDAVAALEEARDRVELARLSLEQAELLEELAKMQEELGAGSSLDALTASVDVTSAKLGLLTARGQLELAVLSYQRTLGN